MTQARFELNDYSVRVLDVIKGKYGLKNRNEALNKFIKEHGENYVEPEIEFPQEVVKHFNNVVKEHKTKYGNKPRPMSMEEVDKLLGLDE